MNFIARLQEIKAKKFKSNRILIVGTEPSECAELLNSMIDMSNFNLVVVDVDYTCKGDKVVINGISTSHIKDNYTVTIPSGCIVAESRRRIWFRGHVWDFFTSFNSSSNEDYRTLRDANIIIFITNYQEYLNKFSNVIEFFQLNDNNCSVKMLIIDLKGHENDPKSEYKWLNDDNRFGLHEIRIVENIDSYTDLANDLLNIAIQYNLNSNEV